MSGIPGGTTGGLDVAARRIAPISGGPLGTDVTRGLVAIGDFDKSGLIDVAVCDFFDLPPNSRTAPMETLHLLHDPFYSPVGDVIRPVLFNPTGVAVADFDNCMGNDIAVVTYLGDATTNNNSNGTGTVQIFFQDPHEPNHFPLVPQQTLLLPDYSNGLGIATGDFNADGVPDLVVAFEQVNPAAGFLRVYICDPFTRRFIAQQPVRIDGTPGAPDDTPTSICVADFEGDCLHDVAVMTAAGAAYIARGDLSAPGLLATPVRLRQNEQNDTLGPSGIAARDLTWDGRPELILGYTSHTGNQQVDPSRLHVLTNTYPCTDPPPPQQPICSDMYFLKADAQLAVTFDPMTQVSPQPGAVTTGTFKGAQGPFIAAADVANQRVVTFTRTDFTDPLYTLAEYRAEPGPASIAAGDLDANGDDDLVTANQSDRSLSVLLRSRAAGGTFENAKRIPLDAFPQAVAVADIDGDGTGDIVVVGGTSQDSFLRVISSCARTTLGPCTKGDMNNDGRIDGDDEQSFVDTIINPIAATPIMRCRADMNNDGGLDDRDRDLFVCALLQNPGPCCPGGASFTGGGSGGGSGGDAPGAPNAPSSPSGGGDRPPPPSPEQRLAAWETVHPRGAYPGLTDRQYAQMRVRAAVWFGADDAQVYSALNEYLVWAADNRRRQHPELSEAGYNQLCVNKLADVGMDGERP